MSALHAVPDLPEAKPAIDTSVIDAADVVCQIEDRRREESLTRDLAVSYLYETVGKAMLLCGKKTLVAEGFVYHLEPPQERLYCRCHSSLVYQCPNGPTGLGEPFTRMDAKATFWVRRAKEKA